MTSAKDATMDEVFITECTEEHPVAEGSRTRVQQRFPWAAASSDRIVRHRIPLVSCNAPNAPGSLDQAGVFRSVPPTSAMGGFPLHPSRALWFTTWLDATTRGEPRDKEQ